MALKSIEDEWNGFEAMVFRGKPASRILTKEMKKAFFAGAFAMFTAVEEIGHPHVSAEEGFRYLEDRRKEMLEFKKRIIDEYAESN